MSHSWGQLHKGTYAPLTTGNLGVLYLSEKGMGHREGKPPAQKREIRVKTEASWPQRQGPDCSVAS